MTQDVDKDGEEVWMDGVPSGGNVEVERRPKTGTEIRRELKTKALETGGSSGEWDRGNDGEIGPSEE